MVAGLGVPIFRVFTVFEMLSSRTAFCFTETDLIEVVYLKFN